MLDCQSNAEQKHNAGGISIPYCNYIAELYQHKTDTEISRRVKTIVNTCSHPTLKHMPKNINIENNLFNKLIMVKLYIHT